MVLMRLPALLMMSLGPDKAPTGGGGGGAAYYLFATILGLGHGSRPGSGQKLFTARVRFVPSGPPVRDVAQSTI